MTIYEIDERIAALINEDGEIADIKEFDDLQMARDEKIENVAMWFKNLVADAKSIKEEEGVLKARREAMENKAEGLKRYLSYATDGKKFETPRVKISYRSSDAIEFTDAEKFMQWAMGKHDDLLNYAKPTPNKTAIKAAINGGTNVEGAFIATHNNISIK